MFTAAQTLAGKEVRSVIWFHDDDDEHDNDSSADAHQREW